LEVNGTAIAGSGGVPTPTSDVSVAFDASGYGSIKLKYWDVGQIKLYAQGAIADPSTGGTVTVATGASNAFVVKPYDFAVLPCAASVVGACTVSDVPADPGLGGGGAVFAKAGAAFKATVTARAFGGAATPSFGAGSNNGTETVDLTRTRVAPAGVGAADGTLGGTTAIPRSSFSNGVATVNDLSWSEVGVITLTATNSTFLGNTLTTTGTTGNIGRFYPDHFDTAIKLASGLPMPCPTGLTCPSLYNGFVYSDQPFTAEVTAKNQGGATTQNYDGTLGYAKTTTLQAWDTLGGTATQNPNGSLSNSTVAAAAFDTGVATTSTPAYQLTTATTAPTDIYLRAIDADNVSSLRATSVEGGVKVASGRIKVGNAYGSEKLPLTVKAIVQYYTGAVWQLSSTDNVTNLTLPAPYDVKKGAVVTSQTTPATPVAISAGEGSIQLGKPDTGGTGNATILPVAPSYMPVISGTATFGIYKGGKEFIYLREAY
jgi:MSHA biogenesis protein MshQ